MREPRLSVILLRVRLRYLIVDDSASFLAASRRLLEREGLNVVGVASTIRECLRRVSELGPDVILVDVDLGEDSGFDSPAGWPGAESAPTSSSFRCMQGGRLRRSHRRERRTRASCPRLSCRGRRSSGPWSRRRRPAPHATSPSGIRGMRAPRGPGGGRLRSRGSGACRGCCARASRPPFGHLQATRDPRVRTALGHQCEHFALAPESSPGVVAAPRGEELPDERGVDHRAATGDPVQRQNELLDSPPVP